MSWLEFPDVFFGTAPLLNLFNMEAASLELLVAQLLFALRAPARSPGAKKRTMIAIPVMMLAALLCVQCTIAISTMQRSILNFSLIFVISIALIRLICRCDWQLACGIAICGYAVQHVAAATEEIMELAVAGIASLSGFAVLTSWLVNELIRIVVFICVYAAFWHWYIRTFDVAKARLSSPASLAALTGSTLAVTIGLSSYAYAKNLDDPTEFAIRAISALTCIIILLLFGEVAHSQALTDELAFVQHMNGLRTNYYEQLKDTIETTNVHYHDLKHQIARLRAATSQASSTTNSVNATHQILDEIADSVSTYDHIAKTGNAAFDVVLTQKSLEAARKNIHFTYMADAACVDWMSDYDIYSLFGNALDNAIEAVEKLENPEQRVIKLTAVLRGNLVNIHISNYYNTIHCDDDGTLRTTKTDAASHGYGITSMRMIAERLGGDLAITTDNDIFDLGLILPKP
ncbi:signal transduction histidine kinase regulating citrate/malate metabolism [Bifidobacterium imperatoris]|nr:signal transduction histidine kinase regulating citrate/malate metabolism [Bifidobacterium imperatoris]